MAAKMAKMPKKKCCVSKSKCGRCPLRMLAEGRLPAGYTVKKRRLVKLDVNVKQLKSAKIKLKDGKKKLAAAA